MDVKMLNPEDGSIVLFLVCYAGLCTFVYV